VYADFAEIFRGLFGVNWPVLSLFKAFGFCVAVAFFAAGYVLYLELKRKAQQGLIGPGDIQIQTIDTKFDIKKFLPQALFGLVVGYKVGGLFTNISTASADPLSYIASTQGNMLTAIIGALLFAGIKYSDLLVNRKKHGITDEPIKQRVRFAYHYRVADIALVAALGGFAGAKIFNAFETWDDFINDPIGNLFSSSGLTFYGGLIVATIALLIYTRKWKLPFKHLCDAAAPALILAYGVGRLGCQISGDGDWGIHNSAYVTTIEGKAVPAQQADAFEQAKKQYSTYFASEFGVGKDVPHKKFVRPAALSFLPHWLFAYSYSHNVNRVGIKLEKCEGNYCTTLPVPVFPTPLYEFTAGVLIFAFLWSIRKKLKYALDMFGVYLVLNGIERFGIEQMRVNSKYNLGTWSPTQAEIIAICLVLAGLGLLAYNRIVKPKQKLFTEEEVEDELHLQPKQDVAAEL
jgi:phosphatidylglycerol---prolipoprotein diacylglyceryl transferase